MYSLYFYHDCCNFTVLFRQPAYYHLTKGKIPRSNSLYAHLLKNKQDIPHRIYNAGLLLQREGISRGASSFKATNKSIQTEAKKLLCSLFLGKRGSLVHY